uniref:Uncharacterized protein n=1 Tax=Lepeophtheirus salmonis TaxID=72036 RepID=A0A0K2UN21_LEPSM
MKRDEAQRLKSQNLFLAQGKPSKNKSSIFGMIWRPAKEQSEISSYIIRDYGLRTSICIH